MGFKELFKDLIRVVGKSVASLQLALSKKTFPELFPTILIVKRTLDRVTEHFVGL